MPSAAPRLLRLAPARGSTSAFFAGLAATAPAWRNEVLLRSLELAREWEPAYVARTSPTPLLMVVATHDLLTPTDLALLAYERALSPKRLVLLGGGHFAAYEERFAEASGTARDWFAEPLGPTAPLGGEVGA